MNKHTHSATDSALGFRYQGLYALLMVWKAPSDDTTVYLETLDDLVLVAHGQTLLQQLKHSLSEAPSPITLKSTALWKTIKAWADIIPQIDLTCTTFNLVSVAPIQSGSALEILSEVSNDRSELLAALVSEAQRVRSERNTAKANGKTKLPHKERAGGCEAFLSLGPDMQSKLVNAVRLKPSQTNIAKIEGELAGSLTSVPTEKRTLVAQRLVEWWDRQVLYSMCGEREKGLTRFEVVQKHSEIVSEIELDTLPNPFETLVPPDEHVPDSMIEKQIALVGGSQSELNRAIREEWRARETRSAWSTENPARHDLIVRYDARLIEEWSDRHAAMAEQCDAEPEQDAQAKGHDLLVWSHFDAPAALKPISPSVVAPYYIRGSYQVLSTTGKVGWHPDFKKQLGFVK